LASDLVRQLVDAGIHFGHRASRWNPKMAPYIFGKRTSIHIVDIRETVKGLLRAKKFITQTVAKGKDVLFVGTKRQARMQIRTHATRVGMPYVAERWLGGTLTNFRTIRSRLERLVSLETAEADGTALEYSKKMISSRAREMRKIRRNLEGIRNMERLPGAMIVIDVHREKNAVAEAKKLGIPTVCLIDTDSDPDFADVPIPGNDDAIRSIETILMHLAEAVELGKKGRTLPDAEDVDSQQGRRPRRPTSGRADEGRVSVPPRKIESDAERLARIGDESSADANRANEDDSNLTPAAAKEPDVGSGD